jgi:nucleotide-binding universal stress UspA family protein
MAPPYPHIACCLDESEASLRALAEARRLRALGPGRLSLVHVLETPLPGTVLPEAVAALTETPEGSLRWLGELAGAGDYEYPVVLDQQFPPKAVCEWAARVGPDLIVAAAVRKPGQRLLHGAFAGHLAYHAPCPVLLVH